MDNNLLPKRILLLRLLEFRKKCAKKQDGFVPDLIRIAVKNDLMNFVENFMKSGRFPSKAVWNRYISASIASSENNTWQQRISFDSDVDIFRTIHKHIVPHRAWVIAKTNPDFRERANILLTYVPSSEQKSHLSYIINVDSFSITLLDISFVCAIVYQT
ncbi:unnamed protein product [Mytilus coruscus]|uniref:Uncharacterized protein n=1 Tax=Mytilus coruscus TaxID=42192 RepID=A0A6J7ZUJ5_MYTCO|nr:unnamed protein product [Mytilus coruscus]